MRTKVPERCGLTLLELIIVMGLIGLLLGLLLPAVMRVRERSRMLECQARLKTLSTACLEYHELHEQFPPGQLFGEFGVGPDSTAWSWMARILPQLGHHGLYETGGIPQRTLRDSKIADQTISTFLCPSDFARSAGPRLDAGNMLEHQFAVGPTNYKGVSGANWGADESQQLEAGDIGARYQNRGTNGSYDGLSHGDGMFFRDDYRVRRRLGHVTDGVTQTMMLGEDLPELDAYCSWPYANNAYSTCAIPPNVNDWESRYDWPEVQSFRSQHADGLNFAFADGRVQFISDAIDLRTYRALATIAGHEANTGTESDGWANRSESGGSKIGQAAAGHD